MSAELKNATCIRGGREVLTGVSLLCKAHEITALCGPNGAGKTTALSMLTGALAAQSGDVSLENRSVSTWRPDELARRRSVVSQSPVLNFSFDVHEVVAMGRTPHFGRPSAATDAIAIDAAVNAMDLGALVNRNYLTLSGGERQRVNIARALAQVWRTDKTSPAPWIFLDEPTSALDLKHQLGLMRLLKRLATDGWGVIVVLHDLHLVREHADKCALFKGGDIASFGKSRDVLTEHSVQDVFDLDAPYEILASSGR